MTYINNLISLIKKYIIITSFGVTDVIQIIIIAVVVYGLIMWFKRTRAWSLFKGILIVLVFLLLAQIFSLDVILWIAGKALSVSIIALFIIFQPELRRALEELGQRNVFKRFSFLSRSDADNRFSTETMEEVVRATLDMAKEKVGALIVFQMDTGLSEYESTGIKINSDVSSELLENIFVENTPLHDGSVIIRSDKIAAATCYLPLSDNLNISKRYGTRHRAALGLSEVSDAFILVVSEETGKISIAERGILFEDLSESELRNKMLRAQRGDLADVSSGESTSTVNRLMERIMQKEPPENNEEAVKEEFIEEKEATSENEVSAVIEEEGDEKSQEGGEADA